MIVVEREKLTSIFAFVHSRTSLVSQISRTHSHASSSTVHAQQAQAQQSRHRSQHQSGSHSNSQSRNAFDHQNRTPQANQSGTNFSYGLGGTGLINSNSGNHSVPRRSNNANGELCFGLRHYWTFPYIYGKSLSRGWLAFLVSLALSSAGSFRFATAQ